MKYKFFFVLDLFWILKKNFNVKFAGPIPWMMMGELFANDAKGVAGAVAGAINWSMAFVITATYSTMSETFGIGQTFLIFSAFCMLAFLFVFFFVPETKGKSLIEIQRMLSGGWITKISKNYD